MIITALCRGVDFSSKLQTAYLWLYVALFGLSLAAYLIYRQFLSKSDNTKNDKIYLGIQASYGMFITVWAVFISLLDRYGPRGLEVFSYVSLAVASFVLLKPWQSIALFGGEFVLINSLLPLFPYGAENALNNALNTLFICILAITVSIVCYRSKCASYIDKMTIQEQFDKISDMNLQLNKLAITDALTDMYNRRYLESSMFTGRWDNAKHAAGIMIDIDFFKQYNGAFGHAAADECLKLLANVIKTFCEQRNAEAVRFGGEEFFICLFDCDEQTARSAAETLRQTVESELTENRICRNVTISLGVCALIRDNGMALNNLLTRSDRALYSAKRQGRNCVVLDCEQSILDENPNTNT